MGPITFLTYLSVILLIGIVSTLISRKFKIPNILFLLFAGIIIGNISYKSQPLIWFPQIFLTTIAILALALIVFDASSRFKLSQFDALSTYAIKLSLIFLFLNIVFLTIFTIKLFQIIPVSVALIFATLMSGTSPDAVMFMLKSTKPKISQLLEIESIINTPLVVLLPFIILDFIRRVNLNYILSGFIEQIGPFLQQFVTGIGSGILIALIIFKIMKKKYSETLSPLAIITSVIMAYILAENLGGNGVLAVTTLGLFFGNVYFTHKLQLKEISSFFVNSLEILVFVLIGIIIKFPLNYYFILKSLLLFMTYLIVRYISVTWSLKSLDLSLREKIFITLNAQKGIAVAVVAFSLTTINLFGLQTILNLTLLFMLYSIILSTFALKFSKYFVGFDVK